MDKYQLVVDHISDGIMEIDEKGYIVSCNLEAARIDGVEVKNVIGKSLLSVYPTLNKDSSTLYQVMTTRQPIRNYAQTFSNYKGQVITTVNTTLPLLAGDRVVGALEISRDVTEVKQMSERIAELHSKINPTRRTATNRWDVTRYHLDDIITQNAAMIKLKAMALKAAVSNLPVLVCGETGTGKELFVQAIHAASDRKTGAFIAQNCAALPASLLEGILFGTVEGAFTGATNRAGLLEAADDGTIFLDELHAMPLDIQAKLLRFLQEGWLRRVGANQSKKVDTRVIAAINTMPEDALATGVLRRDLYYRLNTIAIELPPLRERPDDIVLLTEHFISKVNRQMQRSVRSVNLQVAELFSSYDWPGNVRELEHVIEGAISMLDGHEITLAELPAKLLRTLTNRTPASIDEQTLNQQVAALERQLIERAMLTHAGNVSAAAHQLGIARQTLQYKLKKLDR